MANRVKEFEQTVARLQKQVEHLSAALEQAYEIIDRQQKEIVRLREENLILHRRLYGPKSDRPSDEAQLLLAELFEVVGDEDDGKDGEDEEEAEPAQTAGLPPRPAKKRKAHAKRLTLVGTGLEERVEVVEPDPAKVTDPATGERYPIITHEETRRLAEEPAKIYVRVIQRPVYCPATIKVER